MLVVRLFRDYWQLLRLHRPTGLWLAMWPVMWALWLAAAGVPPLGLLLVFVLGSVLLRGVACVIDDVADHLFHPGAERNPDRPIAQGRVSVRHAVLLAATLCLLLLMLASRLDRLTLLLAMPALVLAATYPIARGIHYLPQVHLGAAWVWGIPMAYAAVRHNVPWIEAGWLMGASLCWVIAYEAYFVMSSRAFGAEAADRFAATLLGRNDRAVIALLQLVSLLLLVEAGIHTWRGPAYYLGLSLALGFVLRQLWLTRQPGRDARFSAFLHNNGIGAAVFAGLAWDFAFEAYAATKSAALASVGAAGLLTANGCFDPLPAKLHDASVADYGYCVQRDITFTPADWPVPLQLDLYTPQRTAASPVMLMIYGGGWQFGIRHTMELPAKLLARRGYVVLNLSHRFAPAYKFPAQLQDLQQAVHWLYSRAAELHADTHRIGAWGYSSGAHLAAMLALIDPHDPWGAPDIRLGAVVGDGTPSNLAQMPGEEAQDLLGATLGQHPELYRHASPLYQVNVQAPPFFLYSGEKDVDVPLQQSLQLRDALRKAGVPVQLEVLPGAGHTRMIYSETAAAMAFLDRTLKP
jgi:4-hydroxybenzoate polyprenyltransferase